MSQRLQQNLSVTVRGEPAALGLELRPQFAKVVDFTIVHEPEPLAICHGLAGSPGKIDDGETRMTENPAWSPLEALIVGPAAAKNR